MSSINAAAAFPEVARGKRTKQAATAPVRPSRHAATWFAASLSIGAAAIHLAAASAHLEPLGDLALGFYWAALFQAAFALALLARPGSRPLARIGFGINLALIGAWAWSRTIGLPMIPGGPEPVGIADAITVAFQIVLLFMLAPPPRTPGFGPLRGWSEAGPGRLAGSAFHVGIGLVVLATTIAMADGLSGHGDGHGHDRGAAHSHAENQPLLNAPGLVDSSKDHTAH